jgi:hypothetical protein
MSGRIRLTIVVAACALLPGAGSAVTVAASPVVLQASNGKAAGQVGTDHGSDQGEDQGENIGNRASGGRGRGHTSVAAQNHNQVGHARAGAAGTVQSFACTASRALSAAGTSAREPFFCNGVFSSTVYDLVVPAKATCRLTGRATIKHTVEIEVGGCLRRGRDPRLRRQHHGARPRRAGQPRRCDRRAQPRGAQRRLCAEPLDRRRREHGSPPQHVPEETALDGRWSGIWVTVRER